MGIEETSGAAPSTAKSLPLYVGVGGIATASHYAFTFASVEWLRWPPLAASVCGFAVGAVIKYWLNYSVAFRSNERHAIAAPKYLGTLALFFVANAALFYTLNELLGLHYIPAQVLTTALMILPGYLVSRFWVFTRC